MLTVNSQLMLFLNGRQCQPVYRCHTAVTHLQCVSLMWLQMVTKAEVPNYLVVAIDTQLRDDLTAKGYNVYYKDISVSCHTCRQTIVLGQQCLYTQVSAYL